MLSAGNIRIAFALIASLAVHGMLLGLSTGPRLDHSLNRSTKKVTFRLVARQSEPSPEPVSQIANEVMSAKEVESAKKAEPEVIRKVKPLQRKIVRKKPPEVIGEEKPGKKHIVQPEKSEVKAVTPEIPPVVGDTAPAEEHHPENIESDLVEQPAGSGTKGMADVVMAVPLYLSNPPPRYPARARRRNIQGTVILEVTVSAEGKVEQLEVNESCGHRILDEAALTSVREWLFEPGRRNGVPVSMTVMVPVRFALKK